MKLLLDTHAFIWWASRKAKLSPLAISLCEDTKNILLLSVASLWEIQIKHQLSKLDLAEPLQTIVATQQANGMRVLPILLPHVLELDNLPLHHKDPFDRLLVAQAQSEGAVLLSHDNALTQSPVDVRS